MKESIEKMGGAQPTKTGGVIDNTIKVEDSNEENQSKSKAPQPIPNRRHRRLLQKFQGMHKLKRELHFDEWREQVRFNLEGGKDIQIKRADNIDKQISEVFNQKLSNKIKAWKEFGYSSEAINKLKKAYSILFEGVGENWREKRKLATKYIGEANKI